MFARQRLSGLMHGIGIQGLGQPIGQPFFDGERRLAVDDPVFIGPLDGGKTRVKLCIDLFHRQDRCRLFPEVEVQGVADFIAVGVFCKIDMRDLSAGMDTSIGSPRPMDRHRLGTITSDRLFDGLLYRWRIGLALPARKAAAVIFDREFIACHV